MLTKYDEFLCHQIATTFDHVNTSAREWTERVIAHYHDNSGKYHLSLGFGLYPKPQCHRRLRLPHHRREDPVQRPGVA